MASTNQELASALRMFSRFFDLIHQPLAVINERGGVLICSITPGRVMSGCWKTRLYAA